LGGRRSRLRSIPQPIFAVRLRKKEVAPAVEAEKGRMVGMLEGDKTHEP
jgi:hypothetical protein